MKITIFGLAGSGTSTIGKMLSEKLSHDFMSSGNIMRSWALESGKNIYEFEDKVIKKDDSFDIKLDKRVKSYGEKNEDFIFESRLAWYFIPDSFKIYLKCDENVRYSRIQNRENLPLNEIIEKNTKRENELVSRYSKIYPNIKFPPGEDVFDLILDVSKSSPEEIINAIVFEALD